MICYKHKSNFLLNCFYNKENNLIGRSAGKGLVDIKTNENFVYKSLFLTKKHPPYESLIPLDFYSNKQYRVNHDGRLFKLENNHIDLVAKYVRRIDDWLYGNFINNEQIIDDSNFINYSRINVYTLETKIIKFVGRISKICISKDPEKYIKIRHNSITNYKNKRSLYFNKVFNSGNITISNNGNLFAVLVNSNNVKIYYTETLEEKISFKLKKPAQFISFDNEDMILSCIGPRHITDIDMD